MSPESVPALDAQPAGMGEFSRITGVFFEPAKTFVDIAERPRWVVPLVLVMAAALAVMLVFTLHVGWEPMLRHSFEINPRTAEMPAAQREQAIQLAARFAPVGGVLAILVGVPLYSLAAAGILLLIAKHLMGAPVRFQQLFAVMCYSGLPGVISAALTILVTFLKKPEDINLNNPLGFNPGAYMDPVTSSKFVYTIASSLDLFVIWTLLLVAAGLKAAAGRKLSYGGALFVVVLPWAILLLARAGIAGLLG